MPTGRSLLGVSCALACLLGGGAAAQAQNAILGRDAFAGLGDVQVSATRGERSWEDGGFGKTGTSGAADRGLKVEPSLADAILEWKPRFNFAVSGVVIAQYQPATSAQVEISEAFLQFRAPPSALGRFSARVGLLYPPVSLEHEGTGWTTPDMLSASALNSWVGEEIKVTAAEGTLTHSFGDHEVSATVAVFDDNDTSGTLLSFRGWALGRARGGLGTDFPLPPLSAFMVTKQASITTPVMKLDKRIGYYGTLEWRPPAPFRLNATYYDNVGNREAVQAKQWAWETRFFNIGLDWDVDARTRLRAQAMNGETLMGFKRPAGIWVDVGYRAAYVLVSRDYGRDRLSGRVDGFEVNDRTYLVIDNNDEDGWALTGAWRRRFGAHLQLITEVMHVDSRRPSRALAGEKPRQDQTVLTSALRVSF